MAIVLSFNKFESNLKHGQFKLFTDNSALSYVLKHYRKKIGRWCERILKFEFIVHHVKGKDNQLVDF